MYCQRCKERFNVDTRVPYNLPCGHDLCYSCLTNQIQKECQVVCPDC